MKTVCQEVLKYTEWQHPGGGGGYVAGQLPVKAALGREKRKWFKSRRHVLGVKAGVGGWGLQGNWGES